MHHAQLNGSFGEDTGYGVGKALEIVDAGDEYVLDFVVLQVGQDTQPEIGPFAFRYIHVRQFPASFSGEYRYIVYGTGNRPVLFVHNLVVTCLKDIIYRLF